MVMVLLILMMLMLMILLPNQQAVCGETWAAGSEVDQPEGGTLALHPARTQMLMFGL